jgi:hypothetical protein
LCWISTCTEGNETKAKAKYIELHSQTLQDTANLKAEAERIEAERIEAADEKLGCFIIIIGTIIVFTMIFFQVN